MKIALIAPTYLPARRANTIQVMKMAQALTASSHDLRVLVPRRDVDRQPSWDELSHHYGLRQRFEIEWLDTVPNLRSYDYGVKSIRRARQWGADLVYTRLPQAAASGSLMGMPSIYEIHDLPQGRMGSWLLASFLKGRGARGLVVITTALKDALISMIGVPKSVPVILAPDSVDLARYDQFPSPEEARQVIHSKIHFPKSAFVAGYTGHLYPGRGSDLILELAGQLVDVRFLLVGGEESDVGRIRQKIRSRRLENVTLTGFVPNAELPLYQAACDILLMPYQRKVAASSGGDIARYLSPMKLFEYMACNRAILSSDLPVLQEILNADNAVLLPPDDLTAWVTAVQDLIANPVKRAQLGTQAQKDAQQYSWMARAQIILSVIESGFPVSAQNL